MRLFHATLGLLLTVCLALGGAISGAPRVSAANTPDATALLQQSIASMKGSIHTAHASGRSTTTMNKQNAAYTVTGTCALSGTRLNVLLHLKGTTIGDRAPTALNEEDGLIWSQSPAWVSIFTRPARANEAWTPIDPFDSLGAQLFGIACPLIMVKQLDQQTPADLTLVGPVTVGSEATWHLRSTVTNAGGTQRTDLYIGQDSLTIVRISTTVKSGQTKQTSTIDYSAFNEPVTIALPSVKPVPGRALHTATRLADGRVMVIGGVGVSAGKAITLNGWADLYDPATATWSRVSGLPSIPNLPTITVDAQGRLILNAYFYPVSAPAQLFDPVKNTWTVAPKLLVSRMRQMSAVLKDGQLLIAGGFNIQTGQAETSAEIYDPALGTWSKTGSLNEARFNGAFTALLKDGRLLVVGGTMDGTPSAEIYQPSIGTWSRAASATQLAHVVGLWALPGGKVLAIGPSNGEGETLVTTTYDPARNSWSNLNSSPVTADSYASVLLKNGKVLVAGGIQMPGALSLTASAWLFNPATGKWSVTGSMKHARAFHTMTVLAEGNVLVAGGFGSVSKQGPFNPLNSTELYNPATGKWSSTGSMK